MDRKRSSFYFSPVRWPRPLPRRRRRASACSVRQDASGGVVGAVLLSRGPRQIAIQF
jgi:hypothetical protein